MDGKPRTARRFTVYKNCPLPTPEDRLLFILVYLKTYALQVVHGRLFSMVQGKANQWIHVLLPALLAALRALGDAPARSLAALAQRLGVADATAATAVTPLEEESAPVVAVPTTAPAAPLLCELARKKENPSLTAVYPPTCGSIPVDQGHSTMSGLAYWNRFFCPFLLWTNPSAFRHPTYHRQLLG
jgi:Helix-turn-helix of DDE superfamily endonuclease